MAQEEQFKRNVAYKFRISDLTKGIPKFDAEKFSSIELNGKRVVRVNVVGSLVDRYASEGEKKFLFFTLDDGSGQIKLKTFGDDLEKFKSFLQGQTVLVIGLLRFYNNEIYISPEIIREQDPRYLLVRKMEMEKSFNQPDSVVQAPIKNPDSRNLRSKIIDLIRNSESEGGIEIAKIGDYVNSPPDAVKNEVNKFLEEGIVFEPRPGKIRWLG